MRNRTRTVQFTAEWDCQLQCIMPGGYKTTIGQVFGNVLSLSFGFGQSWFFHLGSHSIKGCNESKLMVSSNKKYVPIHLKQNYIFSLKYFSIHMWWLTYHRFHNHFHIFPVTLSTGEDDWWNLPALLTHYWLSWRSLHNHHPLISPRYVTM